MLDIAIMTDPSKFEFYAKKSDLNSSQFGHFLADHGIRKGSSDPGDLQVLWSTWCHTESHSKKFKIRLWDTGEETYLWQTSVKVLSNHSHQDGKQKIPTDILPAEILVSTKL